MLRKVLRVDKLCAFRFITILKAYDCNSSYYKREVSSLIASEFGVEVMNNLYSPDLTAASLAKFTMSPVGFERSLGCESSNHKLSRKLNFSVHICYLLAKRS